VKEVVREMELFLCAALLACKTRCNEADQAVEKVYMYVHICMRCIYIYMWVYVYECICVYMCIFVYVYVYVYLCVLHAGLFV